MNILRFSCLTIVVGIGIELHAMEKQLNRPDQKIGQKAHADLNADRSQIISLLKRAADNYTDFMNRFGQGDSEGLIPLMQKIFTPNCRKIVNDTVEASAIKGLHNQISLAKSEVGLFSVNAITPTVIDIERDWAVVHYRIPTEKAGIIVVIKYLKCDRTGLIDEINEVFNTKKAKL